MGRLYNEETEPPTGLVSEGHGNERLSQPSAGHAAIAAVMEWLERRYGVLTFRLTQVLTGIGHFGKFVHRTGRDETSGCHHCVDRPAGLGRTYGGGVPRLGRAPPAVFSVR